MQKNNLLGDRIRYLPFLIIPLFVFFISAQLKNNQGPYFTSYQADPSYVYLISSLNLAQLSGYGVSHIDHPGTPVQVIGAIVIRTLWFFTGKENDIVKDVLFNPEKYIDGICYCLLTLNCLGLFFMGVISYKLYSDYKITFLLQLTPFTSVKIISLFSYIIAENFLFFIVCIFITALLLFINTPDINSKKYLKYVVLIGIICGLGVSAKITFIPLIIIPFILFKGIKNKLLLLFSVIISFFIFVIPAISAANVNYFTDWIYRITVYSDRYGTGEPTIIDKNFFLYNIKRIFINEWFFGIAYFSLFLSMALKIVTDFKNANVKIRIAFSNDNNFRLALGIFLAMNLQILIVAKHYGENYMFPMNVMSAFAVFISILIFAESSLKILFKKITKLIYIVFIILILAKGAVSVYNYSSFLKFRTDESLKFMNFVEENSSNSVVTTSLNTNVREYALFFSTGYAGSREKNYRDILNSKYPAYNVYYDNKCYSFNDDSDTIENNFKKTNKIIFLAKEENSLNEFLEFLKKVYSIKIISFEKKFSNKNGQMVYEIRTVN